MITCTTTVTAHVNVKIKTRYIGNSFIKQIQTHVHVPEVFLHSMDELVEVS